MFASSRAVKAIFRHRVQSRNFTSSIRRNADFTHAVVGGGAIGLAIARRLQQVEGAQVVLIEKHGMVGSETSSRNSEVIHAGLYYGHNTLKTQLCVEGKHMMYEYCDRRAVPHMNCGKWIVAQTDDQLHALKGVHDFAKEIGVPIRWIGPEEAQTREPDVRCQAGALESPSTGIVDSHTYMQALHADFEEAEGDTALASTVTRIEAPPSGSGDWKIWTAPPGSTQTNEPNAASEEDVVVTAETIINSAGLYAHGINNMILPPERHRTPYYAKGTYYSYPKSRPKPNTLIYPAPVPGHGGLGTHLTLDMAGRIRFGPDVEWVTSPHDLAPSADSARFAAALQDIQSYLPGIDVEAVAPDYAGIRPKLAPKESSSSSGGGKKVTSSDFYIRREEGFPGFMNLLGMESPGLTSSLAIGELVFRMLYR